MDEKKEKRPAVTVPSDIKHERHKCPDCGDRLFKIKDGIILCRNGHEVGKWVTMKKVKPVLGKVTEEVDPPTDDSKPGKPEKKEVGK